MFHYPFAEEIDDLNKVKPDFLYTVTFRRNWRAILIVWLSDYAIQYYVPKGVSRKLAQAVLEYECYRHLAECGRERSLFESYDDEYLSDLEVDVKKAFKAFWKYLRDGDDGQSVSKGAGSQKT